MFVTIIYFVIINCVDFSEWLTYDLESNNIVTQNLIDNCIESMNYDGTFKIDGFLTEKGIQSIKKNFDSVSRHNNFDVFYSNIFQDNGNTSYNGNHIRNYKQKHFVGFVGRSFITDELLEFYDYKPVLNFLERIITNVDHKNNKYGLDCVDEYDCGKYRKLYKSHDKHGSIYFYVANKGGHGCFHFDQHPFSCVWMINKPGKGEGDLVYGFLPPKRIEYDNTKMRITEGFNWDVLGKMILDKDEDIIDKYQGIIEPNNGDLYCFKGNITVHTISPAINDQRITMVTAYADYDGFTHMDSITEQNDWERSGDQKASKDAL